MYRGKHAKKSSYSVRNILYCVVGGLLVLTILTTWMVSGLFAKYVASENPVDSAHAASTGIVKFELLEHEASDTGKTGIYMQTANEVAGITYDKVIPGVDIPKDPFIRLELKNAEVDYALYVKVVESNLPGTVTYSLTDSWELVDAANGIYKYKSVFEAGTQYAGEIKILKEDTLYVSEHYVGNGQEFTLIFEAQLKQVD